MAVNNFSDNWVLAHPKPPTEFERKKVSGVYVDYDSEADVIALVTISFRPNKYYWIAGVLKHCQSDGVTFRTLGGNAAMGFYKIAVTADGTGPTDDNIDAYVPPGATVSLPILSNIRIGCVIVPSTVLQDFYGSNNRVIYDNSIPGFGVLDFSPSLGAVDEGMTIIVFYKPL